MAASTVTDQARRILEPSFGAGAFLRAVNSYRHADTAVFGAELREEAVAEAVREGSISPERVFFGDFLRVTPLPVDLVIGNPPFVRLRHVTADASRVALHVSRSSLGIDMDTSGSIWMPFVLHALRFLKARGQLALVLPYEITHVKYARPLWNILGRSFDSLTVVRVRERLFPDILQDVVLLFARGFGGSCSTVRFEAYESMADARGSRSVAAQEIDLSAIQSGDRGFTTALLAPAAREVIAASVRATKPVREKCSFNIGYVAGDKTFFHPTPDVVSRYSLARSALRPALTSSRAMRGGGLWTSRLAQEKTNRLFMPQRSPNLAKSEARYIEAGEQVGINRRYKCRVRDPWFVVPGVRVPDLLLSVFSDDPLLMVNDEGFVASNSLLCGFLRSGNALDFATSWYTTLTRLNLELEIHSLGGGVMILIPGEVGRVRIPEVGELSVVPRVHESLARGDIKTAYAAGDIALRRGPLRLSETDVRTLRDAIVELGRWRRKTQSD